VRGDAAVFALRAGSRTGSGSAHTTCLLNSQMRLTTVADLGRTTLGEETVIKTAARRRNLNSADRAPSWRRMLAARGLRALESSLRQAMTWTRATFT
jgi:hypothetical protein